jgi:hypothetical protein
MSRTLAQVQKNLQDAHTHSEREDVKSQLALDIKRVDELRGRITLDESYNDFQNLCEDEGLRDLFAICETTCVEGRNLEQARTLVMHQLKMVQDMRAILDRHEMAESEKAQLSERMIEIFRKHIARDALMRNARKRVSDTSHSPSESQSGDEDSVTEPADTNYAAEQLLTLHQSSILPLIKTLIDTVGRQVRRAQSAGQEVDSRAASLHSSLTKFELNDENALEMLALMVQVGFLSDHINRV